MIALLEREQQALTKPHAGTLETIANEKQALVKEIHTLGGNTRHGAAHTVREAHDIPALAKRARHLNAVNATLLAMHRTSNESRLRLLRGGDCGNTHYRSNGYLGL